MISKSTKTLVLIVGFIFMIPNYVCAQSEEVQAALEYLNENQFDL